MSLLCNIITESAMGSALRIPNITTIDFKKRSGDTSKETPPLKRRGASPVDA